MLSIQARSFAEEIVFRPRAADGPLDNPLKGWCPYTDAGEIHQPYSMVFQYVAWNQLEPSEGDYRFDQWEKSWDTGRGKGKHILFRVYVDYPSLASGMPDWLRKAGVKETKYSAHGGGQSPDYDDPKLIAAMERFIAALGRRYDSHPRVAFIQLGLLGHWGEWHTWPQEQMYASTKTEQRVIEAYRKAFPTKSLMVRYARDHAGKQDWIGFHDDMFPEDTDNGKDWSFLSGLRSSGRTENWKAAIVGGEMVPNQGKRWLGKDYATTVTMLGRAHFSWVGPYCPALEKSKDETYLGNCQQLIRKMGYEFELDELRHPSEVSTGEPLTIRLRGSNNGVAPFYYNWPVELALLDDTDSVVARARTTWDIRKWQPGSFSETADVAFDVAPGTYRLAIGIRDPWQDRPAIGFANDLPTANRWTVFSKLNIQNRDSSRSR